jgi:hypothetical protein
MTFVKNSRRAFRPGRPRYVLPHVSPTIVRIVLLAVCSIAGASWALERHLTRQRPSLLVPKHAGSAEPFYGSDVTEIPLSDFDETDGH